MTIWKNGLPYDDNDGVLLNYDELVARTVQLETDIAQLEVDKDQHAARIRELEDALLAIEPHLPKSTAKNGGPDSYAAHVIATDKVRDALKGCSHPSAVK